LQRITAEETARTLREVHVDIPVGEEAAFAELPQSFGAQRLHSGHAGGPRFLVASEQAHGFCDWLVAKGASVVTVGGLDFVYTARNELWEKLRARLDETGAARRSTSSADIMS
jgi:ATP phosphoribosyltransferase